MSGLSKTAKGSFVKVSREDDIPEGSMFGVTVSGNPILLSKIGGKIYAINAICSHMNGYLPKGELRDHTVMCPVHKAQYDIATGKIVKNVPWLMKVLAHKEATDLLTYEVETVSGEVRIKV